MKRKELIRVLAAAGIEDAESDARLLFRAEGYTDADIYAEDPDLTGERFLSRVSRRLAREPLAYVLGEVDFYRETYFVNESVLIPRADTETLVNYAVFHVGAGAHFADLCTGSGCIACSVLRGTDNTTATALDISEDALAVARKNAEKYGLSSRVRFETADVRAAKPTETFDAVLSNPPYVKDAVYPTLAPEVMREPRAAFVGGADGMDFYRAILQNYFGALKPHGFFAFEIGYDQEDAIRRLAEAHGLVTEIIRDVGGNPRVAVLRK